MLLLARQEGAFKTKKEGVVSRTRSAPWRACLSAQSSSVQEIDDLNKARRKQKRTLNKAYKRLTASGGRGRLKGETLRTSCAHQGEMSPYFKSDPCDDVQRIDDVA